MSARLQNVLGSLSGLVSSGAAPWGGIMGISWNYADKADIRHTYIHIYIFTYIHLYIYTFIHVYMYTSTHPCIYASIHLYIYTSIHIYIYIYTYIQYINIYTYIIDLKYKIRYDQIMITHASGISISQILLEER
jgi:hypothetical protein